jgi:hypothetical protein
MRYGVEARPRFAVAASALACALAGPALADPDPGVTAPPTADREGDVTISLTAIQTRTAAPPQVTPPPGASGAPTIDKSRPWSPLAPFAPFLSPRAGHPLHSPGEGNAPSRPAHVPTRPQGSDAAPSPPISSADRKVEHPVERVGPPQAAPVHFVTLPDAVVIKTMTHASFQACWKHAQREFPPPEAHKVPLHLELDSLGRVVVATVISDSPSLKSCIERQARTLEFPAAAQPAIVDVPLMF